MLFLLTNSAKVRLRQVSVYWLNHFGRHGKTKKQYISVHASWNVPAKHHVFHSMCALRHTPCSISEVYSAEVFCSWFYQWEPICRSSLSSRYISHFCLYVVITYPEGNRSYPWLGIRSCSGLAPGPMVWRISPTGTAERNLHAWNTKLKHSQSRWTHPSTHERLIQLLKVAKPVFGHIEDLIFSCNSHCHNLILSIKWVKQWLNATASQSEQRLCCIYAQACFAWA